MTTQKIRTPWGASDSVVELANGIRRVSTPSHGGYWVPAKLLPQIPAAYRAYASKWSGSEQWYEEDCAWACVAVTFPDVFDWSAGETLQHAKDTVARWVITEDSCSRCGTYTGNPATRQLNGRAVCDDCAERFPDSQ
jgi:hypothetical protein